MGRSLWGWMRRDSEMTAMTSWKKLTVPMLCLLLGLSMVIVRCGGGGGGGGESASDGGPPAAPTAVTIQGIVSDGTPTSPIAQARCRFVAQPDGQESEVSTVADTAGNFTLQIQPEEQGLIECQHPTLATLALSAFVSTIGVAAGTTMTEVVSPASNVITDIILASNTSDPKTLKATLQQQLASAEPNLTTLVEAAVIVFKALLDTQTVTAVDFGRDGTAGETDSGRGGETDSESEGGTAG